MYLITGGLGGLGLLFAKEILQQATNGRIILTGRSALTNEKQEVLSTLATHGTSVEYFQVDISDHAQVSGLIPSIVGKHGQLNGIFHCAGIISDNFILKKTPEEFIKVLLPKVKGTYNLDMACRNIDLDFMVLFSSDSALGSIGQADYAAANGFMDEFAAYRNRLAAQGKQKGHTISINWPLWQHGGMSIDPAILEIKQNTTGIQPMPTQTGLRAFYLCLGHNVDQVLVTIGHSSTLPDQLPFNQTIEYTADKKEAQIPEKTISAQIERFEPDSRHLLEKRKNSLRSNSLNCSSFRLIR
ncbi:MAG: SDR family NAD(P)-dependent oxidoreductase [Bacteroidales bacterium]|nr:SDR family NAD(P)-dependent oxidoreductase [Bacteroidales bacterium]